jgi:TolB-like protein/DNA-binding winged helix-turn-helix (wHTH) protein
MNELFTRAAATARVDLAHEADFTLGHLAVRPALREIAAGGRQEIIDRRVMRVLVALSRARGGVVSRDDLIESCWDGVIVGDDAINSSISRLRKASEASGSAFSIETISGVGYRLKVAEPASAMDGEKTNAPETKAVEISRATLAPTPGAGLAGRVSGALAQRAWTARAKWIAGNFLVAMLTLAGLGFALWHFWPARFVQRAGAPAETSIAVLPFVNMSGDPTKGYLSDGFSEELLDQLADNPRLRVAAQTSSFSFKGANKTISDIARALHVRSVVEGSLRESGNRVRITAELVDSVSGYRMWSASYDRDLADILSLQDDVARAIAGALTHRLLPRPAANTRRKIVPQNYREYLQARQLLDEYTAASARSAFALLTQVTNQEPDFAAGFSALARSQRYMAELQGSPRISAEDFAAANESAQKALSLDPDNLEARAERIAYELVVWDWGAATANLRILMHANPDNYQRLNALRFYYFTLGFPEQALAMAKRNSALNPGIGTRSQVVDDLNQAGDNLEAANWLREIVEKEPNRTDTLNDMCEAYAFGGRIGSAREIEGRLRRLASSRNSLSDFQDCVFDVDVATGDLAAARRIVAGFEAEFPDNYSPATRIAEEYVYLHDFDKASDWFERSYDERDIGLFGDVYWKPGAEYHQTARWKALIERPAFRQWQAEHDRIAAALAAHRDPLN